MPALVTHNLFAKDVLEKVNPRIKKTVSDAENHYLIFAQSFDAFLYHPSKKVQKIQAVTHRKNVQLYFINLIRIIKETKNENNPEALAYLYGSITHYVLDSMCHPFVFYKTGCYDKKDKNSYKYNGLHARMEYMLDSFMYESRSKKRFYKWKFWNEVLPKVKVSKELEYIINQTFKKTYNKDNISKLFFFSTYYGKILYRILLYDPTGIKKFLFKIYDALTPWKKGKYQYYSFHIKNFDLSLLNITHKEWNNPCDKEIISTDSFIDLYNKGIEKSAHIINEIDKVLNGKKNIETLLEVIPNISYVNGLPIEKFKKMQYFEN